MTKDSNATGKVDWDNLDESIFKKAEPSQKAKVDWDNIGDTVLYADDEAHGYGTAAKTGIAGGFGHAVGLFNRALKNFAKPSYMTDEEWEAKQLAPVRAVDEMAQSLKESNPIVFEPWSGKAITQGVSGIIPFAASLAPATAVIARSGNTDLIRAAGTHLGLKLGMNLAKAEMVGEGVASLTLGAMTSLPEAAVEGQSAYEEAKAEGKNEEEAATIGNAVTGLNSLLITATNGIEFLAAFGKVSSILPKGAKAQLLTKFAAMFGSEGLQEASQSAIPNIVQDKPLDYDAMAQEGVIGGIGGLVFGGAGMATDYLLNKANKPAQEETAKPEEVKSTPVDTEPVKTDFGNLTIDQARSTIDGYRDSLGAGEEYNNMSDLLNSGSDEDIINTAKQILDKQNKRWKTGVKIKAN